MIVMIYIDPTSDLASFRFPVRDISTDIMNWYVQFNREGFNEVWHGILSSTREGSLHHVMDRFNYLTEGSWSARIFSARDYFLNEALNDLSGAFAKITKEEAGEYLSARVAEENGPTDEAFRGLVESTRSIPGISYSVFGSAEVKGPSEESQIVKTA